MDNKPQHDDASRPPRKDGLADEHDDPQTRPDRAIAEENAATSLDQPSGDIG